MPYSPDASPSTEHHHNTTAPAKWINSIQSKIPNSTDTAKEVVGFAAKIIEQRKDSREEKLILAEIKDGIGIVTFNRKNPLNPCSQALMKEFSQAMQELDSNPEVKAMVVWGGKERSFCAGGDFTEVQTFHGGDETSQWIKNIVETFYMKGSLKISKPVIGALDQHVIGTGFQLALTFDWRVATERVEFILPELKNGVACVIGGSMLAQLLGGSKAEEIVYSCEKLDAKKARKLSIANEVVEHDKLLETALARAKKMGEYAALPFQKTKFELKKPMIEMLEAKLQSFMDTHKTCFTTGAQKGHINRILRDKVTDKAVTNDNASASTTTAENAKKDAMNFVELVERPSPLSICSYVRPPMQ